MPCSACSSLLPVPANPPENSRPHLEKSLINAAERMEKLDGEYTLRVLSSLRPEQKPVADGFQDYLLDIATCPKLAEKSRFARIVLPPRTGKTVIAAHLVALSGLQTTFVVPTRNLVHQVADELRSHLPDVPIGLYYGEMKEPVQSGVNVATYNILQRCYRNRLIPKELSDSAMVIADEAHHSMTEDRMAVLENGFDNDALRVALTATPNYNAERRLKHHFPKLISELGLYDALNRDLLAPLRIWVAEVDEDASKVQLIAGDYDSEILGRLMSSAPFFRAAEIFRYQADNRCTKALISCASRRQAHDLKAYLDRHRPKSHTEPALILGETPDDQRIDILRRFENGQIDTLIQVGVLIEGWNSPNCKLLIDLAPSRSRVRATQKFFRVMTKNGDSEARIYVIVPSNLNALPILPTDLFGNPFEDYECGTFVQKEQVERTPRRTPHLVPTPIEGVTLHKRISFSQDLNRPTLDRKNRVHIRRVLQSSSAFNPQRPCGFLEFQRIYFSHAHYVGSGGLLLDHCRVRNRFAYRDWLIGLYPEVMANLLLPSCQQANRSRSNESDLTRLLEEGDEPPRIRWQGWQALGGRLEQQWRTPEDFVISCENSSRLWDLIDNLKPRERSMLVMRFGLDSFGMYTYREIGDMYELSVERVRQIVAKAMRKIRSWWQRRKS
ncbi:MAG: sigma-70 family RNA polymerase sigma factor [Proteobacteria bacterium]|nr:sigma-70 family RNA polymerase sigma factor [Pseudomonadota bacterium]